ncbi:MAG: PAS domain S-box protein [Sedimentibacter saalensis]|uniref:PAS domain S-box protein n=1 Tax=Sedimentibacter saalensis TaxID=130788 RepID=UPI002B217E9B|nr:PAS domain S-box protein [Sedimentibacter saalensis]MEA5094039.1 PAS domain S-box protein [Sedimentibacter saalensis]
MDYNFHKNSDCINKDDKYFKIIEASSQFLKSHNVGIDYESMCETIMELSGAKFVAFNLFDKRQLSFKTAAFIGDKKNVKLINDILGINISGFQWTHDEHKTQCIVNQAITVFDNLLDLVNNKIPNLLINKLISTFKIGKVILVRIESGDNIIGDFTLFMNTNSEVSDYDILNIYGNQVGLYLERVRAEKELYDNKERLRNIIDSTNAGIWEWDIQTGEIKVNDRWAEIIGYNIDELKPLSINTWYEKVHPEDRHRSEEMLDLVFQKKTVYYSVECRVKHKEGHYVWIIDQGKVINWSEDGKPLVMFGTHIDISESKKLADQIKDSQEHYQTLVESSYDIIYRLSLDGSFTYISKAWESLLGHSIDGALGKSFRPYVHPDDLNMVNGFFEKIRLFKKSHELSGYRLKHKDGTWRYYNTYATLIWNKGGQVIGYVGTARDITDITIMTNELTKQKDEVERFFIINLDLLCITDFKGNFVRINKAWETTLGYTNEELMMYNFLELVHPDDIESTLKEMKNMEEGKSVFNFVNRYRCKNGQYLYIEWRSIPYNDLIYAAARDITERIKRQSEVEYLSYRDYLTGLYNRRYMNDSICRLDTERNLPFAIMALDVDDLKLTNDTFGHAKGDQLLIAVSDILKETCREDDIICRVGGDEFVILLPQTDMEAADKIKSRIKQAISQTKIESIMVSISIGYAIKSRADEDIAEVQKLADNRMYSEKFNR